MAKIREIKRRIKSVKTTRQITRAMELVAVTKMRRAELDAKGTRPYASRAWALLSHIMKYAEAKSHPLLSVHNEGRILAVVITPDRGLCGSLTTNILREAADILSQHSTDEVDVITIGKRGQEYFRKRGFAIKATATKLDWKPKLYDIRHLAKIAIDGYETKEYREVFLIYSNFVSTASQEPAVKTLLPFSEEGRDIVPGQESPEKKYLYLIEPSPEEVLGAIIRNLVEIEIFQALLESNASEHSARMVAMHSATENAGTLLDDLSLTYNQARQENITREIAEISAGANT